MQRVPGVALGVDATGRRAEEPGGEGITDGRAEHHRGRRGRVFAFGAALGGVDDVRRGCAFVIRCIRHPDDQVAITDGRCGVRRRNADRRRAGVRGKLGAARGYTRADHVRDHVYWIQRAMSDGVEVIGYNYWSLTINYG